MPFGGLGFGEMVLIFAVLLLLFGAKRLPELASGMGRGIRDFKRAINGLDEQSIQAQLRYSRSFSPVLGFSIYGQVFFVMGLAVALQSRVSGSLISRCAHLVVVNHAGIA